MDYLVGMKYWNLLKGWKSSWWCLGYCSFYFSLWRTLQAEVNKLLYFYPCSQLETFTVISFGLSLYFQLRILCGLFGSKDVGIFQGMEKAPGGFRKWDIIILMASSWKALHDDIIFTVLRSVPPYEDFCVISLALPCTLLYFFSLPLGGCCCCCCWGFCFILFFSLYYYYF